MELTGTKTRTKSGGCLRYPGGKQRALKLIAPLLPPNMQEYREPFVGGGSTFFQAKRLDVAHKYWINDADSYLVSFWECVRNPEYLELMTYLLKGCYEHLTTAADGKDYFYACRDSAPAVTAIDQAVRYFYMNRVSFSGTTRAGGYSASCFEDRWTMSSIDRIADFHEDLQEVAITNWDFERVIEEAGEDVFLFCDPPYVQAKKLYGPNGVLSIFDHAKLATLLKTTEHRFLLTYDDCELVRKLYKWAKIRPFDLSYGMNNCSKTKASKTGKEVFISNY